MAQLKEIKGRIASVNNTLKITSSMKRVASAKLHRTQNIAEGFSRYEEPLKRIVASLWSDESLRDVSPLMSLRENRGRAVVVAFSSDSSFCGAFNSNLGRALMHSVATLHDDGYSSVEVWPVAERIAAFASREGCNVCRDHVDIVGRGSYDAVAELADCLMDEFLSGRADRVSVLYGHYHSMAHQKPRFVDLLPLSAEAFAALADQPSREYILEPSPRELLATLLPSVVRAELYCMLLDSAVAEHAARMVAMQTATDNGEQLLEELTLSYNKRRQQAITDELSDIMNSVF